MNKEQIKKAADEFASREYEINEIDRDYLHKGFYHGALWCINSMWNTNEVNPGYDCKIIIEHNFLGKTEVITDLYDADYQKLDSGVDWKDVIRWAYISDIIPQISVSTIKK